MGTITFLIIGLVAGAIARLIVPGDDPMGGLGTMLLGVIGPFFGGFLAALTFEGNLELSTTGVLGSIIGSVVALLVYRAARARGVTA